MSSDLFGPEHEDFRLTIREYIQNELAPNADEWEAAGEVPRGVFEKMGSLGYLGMRFPEEYGGGDDILSEAVFHEELGHCRSGGTGADLGAHIGIAMPHILTYGTDEQKKKYLVPGIKGEWIGCLAITEPDAGSDVAGIKTKAERDGDNWVINGSKTFITNGARCDFMVLAAKTIPEKGYGGISMFVVDVPTPGFEVTRKLDKLGWRASSTGELAFTDMVIPGDALLGEINRGFYQIMGMFVWERLILSLGCVGGAQVAMDGALAYAKQRQAFGQPIGNFQVIAHYFADMATKVEAGRRLTYHALKMYVDGKNPIKEASEAKLFCGRMACEVVDTCLQIFGGYGFMEEYEIARGYRDIRLMPIGGGTDEVMKEIISRMMGLG
ncbi:MAG: acyl-CoA dehydrogenase family protein [Actinobacteria bacterium]|nr:acyl-CoA dehydrogenase family protein [Actinomycetota bacterium]MBU1945297.1 acyl-CoA dehydrogenase family protein [Actinomycetota bacterium]MBU2686497.1 acyl-CoA dehydrogenase family protein [Actinomycetota bacterium]